MYNYMYYNNSKIIRICNFLIHALKKNQGQSRSQAVLLSKIFPKFYVMTWVSYDFINTTSSLNWSWLTSDTDVPACP